MAQKSGRLLEGFAANVGQGVRQFFATSPEMAASELKRGGQPGAERTGVPYSLVSQYGYDNLAQHLRIDQDLVARFADYEEMDEYPEISSALDIYADDATMPDMEQSKSIWVTSTVDSVAKELDEVLHKRILIENDIWGLARTIAKYGNGFGELLVAEQGLVGINYLPPPTVRRVEGPNGELIGFLQDNRGEFNISLEDFYKLAADRNGTSPTATSSGRPPGELTVFEDWEVVHWRLRGKHMRSMYGSSVVDPARWIWKRLALLEDALLIYKLSRAPSRYAFYVDIGEMDANRGLAYVNQVKNGFKKQRFMNPQTGKLDMRYNPLSMDEDFFLPSRNGKDSTRIEILQGPDYAETDTLEYNRDKLVSAIKVPKAYLGYGGESTRASLSSEDVRFARTVMRIQREMRVGFRQACRVHLAAIGADPSVDYEVQMSVPSAILELAKIEVLAATSDLALRMGENVPQSWILTKLYKFSEEQAIQLMAEKDSDLLRRGEVDAEIQSMIMQAQTPEGGDGSEDGSEYDDGSYEHRRRTPMLPRIQEMRKGGLSKVMKARRKDWERGLMGKPKTQYAEDKLRDLANKDPEIFRRLTAIEGLLQDVRSQMRPHSG